MENGENEYLSKDVPIVKKVGYNKIERFLV